MISNKRITFKINALPTNKRIPLATFNTNSLLKAYNHTKRDYDMHNSTIVPGEVSRKRRRASTEVLPPPPPPPPSPSPPSPSPSPSPPSHSLPSPSPPSPSLPNGRRGPFQPLIFEVFSPQIRCSLGMPHAAQMLYESKEVARAAMGLLIKYAANSTVEISDFLHHAAISHSAEISHAFSWDVCTANKILQELTTKFPDVYENLGIEKYQIQIFSIRTSFRHAYAHTHNITNAYILGLLWLDAKIAGWSSLTQEWYEEIIDNEQKIRCGTHLEEIIKKNRKIVELAIYKEYKSEVRDMSTANKCLNIRDRLFNLAGETCIEILKKFDYTLVKSVVDKYCEENELAYTDFQDWKCYIRLLRLVKNIWPKLPNIRKTLKREWVTIAPVNHLLEFFYKLPSISWYNTLQLSALYYTVGMLVQMEGKSNIQKKFSNIEKEIEENIAYDILQIQRAE